MTIIIKKHDIVHIILEYKQVKLHIENYEEELTIKIKSRYENHTANNRDVLNDTRM